MNRLILVVALALVAGPVAAQKKMYRCGNVFQERPCEGPKQAAPKDEGSKAAAPVGSAQDSRREAQKEVRCENYGRQRDYLAAKKREMKNAEAAKSLDAQIGAVEKRMREDRC